LYSLAANQAGKYRITIGKDADQRIVSMKWPRFTFNLSLLWAKKPKKLAKPQIICDKSILRSLFPSLSLSHRDVTRVSLSYSLSRSVVAFVVFKFAGIFRNNKIMLFLSAPFFAPGHSPLQPSRSISGILQLWR